MSGRKPALSPRKEPRQERSRQTVDAILEATRRILLGEGHEALTMSRIAEVAGVSPGTLYQYFPGAEAVVVALYERVRHHELAAFRAIQDALRPYPLEQAVEQLLMGLSQLLGEGAALATELLRCMPAIDEENTRVDPIDDRVQELITEFLRERAGETRDLDPELGGMIATRGMLGVVRHALTHEPHRLQDPRFFAELVEQQRRYILP